jgi:hypothetical protein
MDGPSLFLTQREIDEMCEPLTQPAAQVRFLRASGLTVTVKPNHRPAVLRSHASAVLSGQRAAPAPSTSEPPADEPKPDMDAFMKTINGSKRHGPQKKVQPA